MSDVIYEDGAVRIEIEPAPPPGFVALLQRIVWGTGAVRYTMLDIAERVRGFAGSHFLALRDRGELVGTYVLAPRTMRIAGEDVPALYRTLLAVDPARAGGGLGLLLAREARRHFLSRAPGPLVLYGFVEAENAASLAATRRAGHEAWGSFIAAPLTRRAPRDDASVELLAPAEIPALAAQLGERYRDHVAWRFEPTLRAVPCYAVRAHGAVVAAAQALPHRWRLHGLSGAPGWLARHLLPRLPGVGHLIDPDDLRFASIGTLYAAPGNEHRLAAVVETILARGGLHAGLLYLDPRGEPQRALRQGTTFGLVHAMGVRPRVHMMCSAIGLPEHLLQAIRTRPLCLSATDDV